MQVTSSLRESRWFTVAAGVSLLFLALISYGAATLHPRRHYLSLRLDLHVSLSGGGLSFYNDARSGPYRGGIIGFSDNPRGPTTSASNFPFYYRHFTWPQGRVLWTLTIYFPWLLLLFALSPVLWLAIRVPSVLSADRR